MHTTLKFMAVLVIYGRSLNEVSPWPVLRDELERDGDAPHRLEEVFVYDNSPLPLADPPAIPRCTHVHDENNGGTAAAYTRALKEAERKGIDWLLLLDHDTLLPTGFMSSAAAALAAAVESSPAALVPWVFHGERAISPARINRLGSLVPLKYSPTPQSVPAMTAISSGSFLHVRTLAALWPPPRALWLDYVDHWIFARLNRQHACIVIFDARLSHDLSVAAPAQLSKARLTSILEGERHFYEELGAMARYIYPARVAARVLRYLLISPRLAAHTLRWIVRSTAS